MQLFVVKSGLREVGPLRRLLLFVLLAAGGGTCRADLLFGVTSGGTSAPLTFVKAVVPPEIGYRVDSEAYSEFCDAPFAPVFLDPLYNEQDSMPDAASLGLPTDAFLFLSVMSGSGKRLWQVSGFIPIPGDYPPLSPQIEFATTGASLSGGADVSEFPLEPLTAGGGQLLAKRFAAGDVISDAVFTSATTQATMLYYEVSGTSAVNVQGEFSQDGYLGFRVEKTDVPGSYYYGWLNITNVVTSLAVEAGGSGFTLYQIAARWAGTGSEPGIVVGETSGPGSFSAVPEPGSFAALGVIAGAVGVRAYRRRVRAA